MEERIMALQMNVNVPGGGTVNDCYVRVDSVRAFKKDSSTSWIMMVDTYVYKNKTERDKGSDAKMILCPEVDRFKFDFDPSSERGDLIALAYTKLKTHAVINGKTTDV